MVRICLLMEETQEDTNLIPESGRFPGGGKGNPLQYSCLENPWAGEPGGLQSRGCKELDRTECKIINIIENKAVK